MDKTNGGYSVLDMKGTTPTTDGVPISGIYEKMAKAVRQNKFVVISNNTLYDTPEIVEVTSYTVTVEVTNDDNETENVTYTNYKWVGKDIVNGYKKYYHITYDDKWKYTESKIIPDADPIIEIGEVTSTPTEVEGLYDEIGEAIGTPIRVSFNCDTITGIDDDTIAWCTPISREDDEETLYYVIYTAVDFDSDPQGIYEIRVNEDDEVYYEFLEASGGGNSDTAVIVDLVLSGLPLPIVTEVTE